MPKLVRSRCFTGSQYHHSSLSVPSSSPLALASTSFSQHVNCTDGSSSGTSSSSSSSCSIPSGLSYYSPMTPPPLWDTPPQHTPHQRKVSEEDMHRHHRTPRETNTTSSSIGIEYRYDEQHDVSRSSEVESISHSLSAASTRSYSSSSSFTSNLKRRKPSVCLTDLVQQQQVQQPETKESSYAAISPILTSLNHCEGRVPVCTNDQKQPQQELQLTSRTEMGESSPSSGWWGHFTTNDDSYVHEFEEDDDDGRDFVMVSQNEDNCWDFNTMAHATSFIPIQPRHNHHRHYYLSTYSSMDSNDHHFRSMSTCRSSSRNNHTTSWRMALTSSSLTPKSRNSDYDHHNHPYLHQKTGTFPVMKQQPLQRPTMISLSTVSSQLRPSFDRFRHPNDNNTNSEPPPPQPIGRTLLPSVSSFDEFILTCPSDRHMDHHSTESSIDIATVRMSVLGL